MLNVCENPNCECENCDCVDCNCLLNREKKNVKETFIGFIFICCI